MGEEKRHTEKKELTPLQVAEIKIVTLEGIIKIWEHKCTELQNELDRYKAAENAAMEDIFDDSDFEGLL